MFYLERVQKRRCNQCLFSKNKIVSEARKADILQDCADNNKHFVCHKASIKGQHDVRCRGFYDEKQDPHINQAFEQAGLVDFVTVE